MWALYIFGRARGSCLDRARQSVDIRGQRRTLRVMPSTRSTRLAHTVAGGTVQAWVLPYLSAWLEKQGIDSTSLRRLPGITDLSDPDARVPEATAEAAWRLAAAAVARDSSIGVHVAESLPRGALDLVEYAFRSSASLAAGLARLARYGRVISDRVAARLDTRGEGLLLLVRDTGSTPLHPGRAEFALATALRFAREGTGENITPLRVCFAHAAPHDTSEHRRFFGIPVRFGAGSNSMLVSAADAARPLQGADEALSAVIRRRLEKILAKHHPRGVGPLSGHVRHVIMEHLGASALTAGAIAGELHVSRRTLSRRLSEEGTSFRSILDDVRREFACALLQDHYSSVADVAFFLQYSEPAAFNRAFRRWTGQTPSEFRNAPSSLNPENASQ
jgi:AraC-like DNA-binding protein